MKSRSRIYQIVFVQHSIDFWDQVEHNVDLKLIVFIVDIVHSLFRSLDNKTVSLLCTLKHKQSF